MVPVFLLQPIVENSIKHGVARNPDGGEIEIRAASRNGMLELHVTDNGAGIQGEAPEGIGLSNTRLRLRQLYGERFVFSILPGTQNGTHAMMTLPFRVEPS
jgi:LytS/YehU family sensor histidine kinase